MTRGRPRSISPEGMAFVRARAAEGWRDAAIAAALGVSGYAVMRARRAMGLAAPGRGRVCTIPPAGFEVIRARHAAGVCDLAIAVELGVREAAVLRARRAMGLRSNWRLRAEARRAAVAAELGAGASDSAIAARLGIPRSSVAYARAAVQGGAR